MDASRTPLQYLQGSTRRFAPPAGFTHFYPLTSGRWAAVELVTYGGGGLTYGTGGSVKAAFFDLNRRLAAALDREPKELRP